MILYGPPGSGKTTLARIVAHSTGAQFEELSAVSATVKDVREVLAAARERLGAEGRRTILFLDEIHRFNKAQQDALLPAVEEGLVTLIGATTENPDFEGNSALMSRMQLYTLEPLSHEDVALVLQRGAAVPGVSRPGELGEPIARRARPGARARGPAGGEADPGAGGDLPRARAEVDRRHPPPLGRAPRRARARHPPPAEAAPRRPLPRREEPRPRRGLRLSALGPGGLRGRLPARRAEREEVLQAGRVSRSVSATPGSRRSASTS